MKRKESVELLRKFLTKNYIKNPKMGSGNMDIAVRDLLTDLFYIAYSQDNDINLFWRLEDAGDVFNEENKNGFRKI